MLTKYDDMLSRLDIISELDTDGHTDKTATNIALQSRHDAD